MRAHFTVFTYITTTTHNTEALKGHQDKALESKNQGRNWNIEFQALVDKCDKTGIGMEEMRQFSELGYDFSRSATTYAKYVTLFRYFKMLILAFVFFLFLCHCRIIVDELYIDNEHKTIKRAAVGG